MQTASAFFAVALLSLAGAVTLYALRPLPQRPAARAWREINREALLHNAAVLGRQAGPGCSLMAVVKADAYGHGMVPVARTLQKGGVRAFAVACLSEAIVLRKAGIRGVILVLGYTAPEDVPLLCRWRITQTIVDEAHAQALSAQGRRLPVHLALDTGMHRGSGFPPSIPARFGGYSPCRICASTAYFLISVFPTVWNRLRSNTRAHSGTPFLGR